MGWHLKVQNVDFMEIQLFRQPLRDGWKWSFLIGSSKKLELKALEIKSIFSSLPPTSQDEEEAFRK